MEPALAAAVTFACASAGGCRYVRLRGGRALLPVRVQCHHVALGSPRGIFPSLLPSSAAAGNGCADDCLFVLLRPAKRTAGRRGDSC